MSKRQKYLCIHCSSTPPDRILTPEDIDQWHKGPRDEKDGSVVYLGKRYPNRDYLPDEYIGGKHITDLHGRGWDRRGYREMIHRNGKIEELTSHDHNGIIDYHEVTWGAVGINSISQHVMLEGGWLGDKHSLITDFFKIFTDEQFVALMQTINHEIQMVDWVKVIGHNDVSGKTCPNIDVPELLKKVKIPLQNIGL